MAVEGISIDLVYERGSGDSQADSIFEQLAAVALRLDNSRSFLEMCILTCST